MRKMTGKVSNETVVAEAKAVPSHPDFPEIELRSDTFSIKVKDDEENIIYENDEEPYQYYFAPSLASHLKYNGAKLDDSQMQFLGEALSGSEETGKAVVAIVKTLNDEIKAAAKQSAYSRVFNAKKPVTEEQIDSAHANYVRSFLRTNQGVSVETAIESLKNFNLIPKEYTVKDFNSAPGRGRKASA